MAVGLFFSCEKQMLLLLEKSLNSKQKCKQQPWSNTGVIVCFLVIAWTMTMFSSSRGHVGGKKKSSNWAPRVPVWCSVVRLNAYTHSWVHQHFRHRSTVCFLASGHPGIITLKISFHLNKWTHKLLNRSCNFSKTQNDKKIWPHWTITSSSFVKRNYNNLNKRMLY